MTALSVADIATYLADTGWDRRAERWRGAAVWADADGREVLVPEHDDRRDAEQRVAELLGIVATAEGRARDEVAIDIASPLVDVQSYRTFPTGLPTGLTTLDDGARALEGVRDALVAAARVVVQGPHGAFRGNSPRLVDDLSTQAQLGPTRPGSYVFSIRVPVGRQARAWDGAPFGRRVLQQMHDALVAVRTAAGAADPAAFDDVVTAGVSANLCTALSKLAGRQRRQPFEVGFRWARALPTGLTATTVRFPQGTAPMLDAAAERLRHHGASGAATVRGMVESLHDDPPGEDRWRVKVRGSLVTARSEGTNRTVWVRLGDQVTYDLAISAHRRRAPVSAEGELTSVRGRVELVADRFGADAGADEQQIDDSDG